LRRHRTKAAHVVVVAVAVAVVVVVVVVAAWHIIGENTAIVVERQRACGETSATELTGDSVGYQHNRATITKWSEVLLLTNAEAQDVCYFCAFCTAQGVGTTYGTRVGACSCGARELLRSSRGGCVGRNCWKTSFL